jgi:tRNA(fMet)-specific endonuclease VapC
MSLRYILDTDHVSLLQRGNVAIAARLDALAATAVAITMITADEQLQGRLTIIRRARTQVDIVRGYERLYETLRFYNSVALVLYDAVAAARFDDMRRQGIRIGPRSADRRDRAHAGHNTAHTEYPRFQPDTWADHRRLVASTIAADEL